MWPWDHLALGYLLYTTTRWVGGWPPPDGRTVLVLGLGTQLPDLLDKPLAWSLHWLPSGTSLGHSVFFVGAVSLAALVLARRFGRPTDAVVLALGLGSHLLGDVLFAVLVGSARTYELALWPLLPAQPEATPTLVAGVVAALGRTRRFLGTPTGTTYLLSVALLWALVVVQWVRDGLPGAGWLRR